MRQLRHATGYGRRLEVEKQHMIKQQPTPFPSPTRYGHLQSGTFTQIYLEAGTL